MTRLLQPDPQTQDSKGLSRWLSSRLDARRVVREAFPPEPPPTEDQLAAQDSMWGVTIEEMKT